MKAIVYVFFLSMTQLVTVSLAHAQSATLTPAERDSLVQASRQLEKNCLAGTRPKPVATNATEYIRRTSERVRQLMQPEKYCACVASGFQAIPPEIVRVQSQERAQQYITQVATACMADAWRTGFLPFCVGLREDIEIGFKDKNLKLDAEQNRRICQCSSERMAGMSTPAMHRFLVNSAAEVQSLLAAVHQPLVPSEDSLSGIFAACGARRAADVFGMSDIPQR